MARVPRREYDGPPLDPAIVDPDPMVEVRRWLDAAIEAGIPDANAICLATADPQRGPSARMVLVKVVDARGLTFFTNLESRKADELRALPRAAAVFHWQALHRQVRVAGPVEPASTEEAAEYFATRSRVSRIGAYVSRQSRPRASREELLAAAADADRTLGEEIPLPPHWGGYRVVPDEVELWQGRPGRIHDRVLYTRSAGGGWERCRLDP